MFRRSAAALLTLLFTSGGALADPGYYVVTAYDNEGQRTLDLRYWTVKTPGEPATLWPEVGFGYGVTSRWYTELFASFIGTMDTATKLSSWNWQNEVLLTQGQYPFDLAIHASLIRAAESYEGYALEIGPVFQTDIGRTQLNANLFFERSYQTSEPSPTQLKYQWQIKHRWHPALQFGLQGFGELGQWDHWAPRDRQSHRAGPAIFGSVPIGGKQALIYQAAILKGQIYGSNGTMFSARVQYAF
jgi:hypothetical protein